MAATKLVVHVVGARPNYMKVAPVYAALEQNGLVEQRLVHTGQHYDANLKDDFFAELPLPNPHFELGIGSGTHGQQIARALEGLERIFLDLRPDLVLVPGDVNSTLAGALAAVQAEIPVAHLEAGLRSFDSTMPEEHNRRLTDHLSTLLLTHSESANDNLAHEGLSDRRIALVGNTMIDTLLVHVDRARERREWEAHALARGEYLLVTLHRPGLVDDPGLLAQTMEALARVSADMPVIFPLHPRTRTRLEGLDYAPAPALTLCDPLPYERFLSLQAEAAAVLTDSGGIQEETTALGVRCFTLRENTERPVTVSHGTNLLLGLAPQRIEEIPSLLDRPLPQGRPPFWDGQAGARAAREVELMLGLPPTPVIGVE